MLISKAQQYTFWRQWNSIVTAKAWPRDQAESERHALLQRAGFHSLTVVDKVGGFTAVLKELAALRDNLTGMVRADANPRRVLLYTIRRAGPYAQAIARDKFGTDDYDMLEQWKLEQLRNTLADRAVAQHKPDTQEARSKRNRQRRQSAASNPESRIAFPGQVVSESVPDQELVAGPF
jgi:hypothetical protein